MIPEPLDQTGYRKRRVLKRRPSMNFDSQAYRGRNYVVRSFNLFEQEGAQLQPATTNSLSSAVLYAVIILATPIRRHAPVPARAGRRLSVAALVFVEAIFKHLWAIFETPLGCRDRGPRVPLTLAVHQAALPKP